MSKSRHWKPCVCPIDGASAESTSPGAKPRTYPQSAPCSAARHRRPDARRRWLGANRGRRPISGATGERRYARLSRPPPDLGRLEAGDARRPTDESAVRPEDGRCAASDDPGTWATRDEAEWWAATKGADGVGVMFSQIDDAPSGGIDLDGCRDPDTENIEPWAQEVIDRFAHLH